MSFGTCQQYIYIINASVIGRWNTSRNKITKEVSHGDEDNCDEEPKELSVMKIIVMKN